MIAILLAVVCGGCVKVAAPVVQQVVAQQVQYSYAPVVVPVVAYGVADPYFVASPVAELRARIDKLEADRGEVDIAELPATTLTEDIDAELSRENVESAVSAAARDILKHRCGSCHDDTNPQAGLDLVSGPFAKGERERIVDEVQAGRMPKAPAPLLSTGEYAVLVAWAEQSEAGVPEGLEASERPEKLKRPAGVGRSLLAIFLRGLSDALR